MGETVKEIRDRKATGDGDVLGDVAFSNCWAKMVSDEWRSLRKKLKVLHLEHNFVWCRNLDTSESRLEIPESFATCRKRMEISWTDRVRNEVYHRVEKERNILHTIKRRKANWVGLILCTNCLIRQVIEGKIEGRIEVTG